MLIFDVSLTKALRKVKDCSNFAPDMSNSMKQIALWVMIVSVVMMSACESKRESFKSSVKDAYKDSMIAIKVEEINRQAMEDLDRRISIEVKAKTDSILDARSKKALPDTSHKAH
jgi:hypothetical protein